MNYKKFKENLTEIQQQIVDLKSIDKDFWNELDDQIKLELVERVITARNFLRVAHSHFDWD
jgi:hypothetical protein